MGQTLRVNLDERSYDICIEHGCLSAIGSLLSPLKLGKRCIVITNEVVKQWYLEPVMKSLRDSGYTAESYILPDGEQTKSLSWLEQIFHKMLEMRLDRKSFVVALGGGVVGDLAGFAAASYMRGIPFVQVPTTLLSQVDSSVGGKTGVNLREGKNLIGAFYQPKRVIIDPKVLNTLDIRELRAGFSEVIKYGVIYDAGFFSFLEKNLSAVFQLEPDVIEYVIARSCAIKAEVVEQDEQESGLRAILNFGHTVGHALESITSYGTYVHGEAVAIGMITACTLGERVAGFSPDQSAQVRRLIERSGLPSRVPVGIPNEQIIEYMRRDKKVQDDTIRFVLPKRIGEVSVVGSVTISEIEFALDANR
ncbi:MAG: 3-dehydroquinate synthase [Candidatus Auribacterota bacterium]